MPDVTVQPVLWIPWLSKTLAPQSALRRQLQEFDLYDFPAHALTKEGGIELHKQVKSQKFLSPMNKVLFQHAYPFIKK